MRVDRRLQTGLIGPRRVFDPGRASRRALCWARAAVLGLSIGLFAILVRVAQLKVHPPEPIARRVDAQRSGRPLHAHRGDIIDAEGRLLATSRIATRLFADPKLVREPTSFARIVGDMLELDATRLERLIRSRSRYRYAELDANLTPARKAALEPLKLPGLGTQRWSHRVYPQGIAAGQLLGVVGSNGQGLEGLEKALDPLLAAHSGRLAYVRDLYRRPVRLAPDACDRPRHGERVRLGIDLYVQVVAEEELRARCEAYGAAAGQIVVMDPTTGRIMAMANHPPFDPNGLARSRPEQRRNRCVTDPFEPGSVFKPFIWAMATDAGIAAPAEMIDCTTGGVYRSPGGRRLRDVHAHGLITWEQVLVKSSNIGMAIVGQRLGAQRLHAAVRAYGFGARTGCGLPGESPGIVRPLRKWNHYSVTSVPMGQEIAATALQLVRAMCAIANHGLLPYPLMQLQAGAGPMFEQVLSPQAADRTRAVLRRVVTEGTGRKANSDLYALFGKTGTAQVPDRVNGGYAADTYVASFIAGAPVEAPRMVVGCFIHRPDVKKGYYGGLVAAPAVRRVIERTLPYLGVPPRPPHDHAEERREFLTSEEAADGWRAG